MPDTPCGTTEPPQPSKWRQILNSDKGPLVPIEKIEDWDYDTAVEQMRVRNHLMSQMVGSLYPRIVSDEVEKIAVYIENGCRLPVDPKDLICQNGGSI